MDRLANELLQTNFDHKRIYLHRARLMMHTMNKEIKKYQFKILNS